MRSHASTAYKVPFDVRELPFDEAVLLAADTGAISGDADPLLETVIDMLDELERPDAHFDVLQVAGTNGKSSTVRFAAALLSAEGKRCALYTSPHLVRYPERMEISGQVVGDAVFAHGVSVAVEAGRRVNERRRRQGKPRYAITPFDVLTVAALVIFAEAAVDVAVLEVGLGGRWDATSATRPVGVAITGIGLDHTRILGDTLAEIAGEKAAIIQPGRFAVLGEGCREPSVEAVMRNRCTDVGVDPVMVAHETLKVPERLGDDLKIRVPAPRATYTARLPKPRYQGQNVACALCLVEEYLDRPLAADLTAALGACPTPGRFDVRRRDPLLLIDACHNPQSCEAFVASIDELEGSREQRPCLLIACLADKDAEGIVRMLVPAFPEVAVVQTASERALSAGDVADLVRAELAREGRDETLVGVYGDVPTALEELAREGVPVVAAGTITLAGEVAALVQGLV